MAQEIAASGTAGPNAAPRAVLALDDVQVSYGTTLTVRGVTLTVAPGEKVGIVGESGSGKSTLALAAMGLLPAGGAVTGGSVSVAGREISGLRERELDRLRGKSMSLVFQDPLSALDPVKSIGSQIGEAIRAHSRGLSRAKVRARAIELLNAVGVPEPARRLGQYPHEYSGGMRQRVLIAIAIANDPAVLIADEPTTALDVTTQAQVLELLDTLSRERGIAVVLVSHDIGVIAEFCDRVVVMYAGRAVEQIEASGLFGASAHPYTVALLDSLPLPGRDRGEELAWIPGAPPAMSRMPGGCAFSPRCAWATDHCRAERPEPRDVSAGSAPQVVECHRAEEVRAVRAASDEEVRAALSAEIGDIRSAPATREDAR
ncbi:ABC transporter ATP-binding protein [Microbacterium paludicola]|uniref:ABC transporter ATP-binding protein n=1 Tax=Microbacterium paludicola TaxID=300019 RepID=A0A4Y9FSB8_9MICO|nr:ABC transporter ATP-binding protein [Microbacterium paludicola]MBF0817168.1 ABC transporter ATP-binding protein [Microbacterium paludicola]TFU32096.1 ABC transporter ATP-binding protein [Microbacterium paludicola]